MRFKKSFIIITITILLISIVGFSVWIISKKFDVKPQPEIEKVITKYLNNSSGTYEGNVLLPSSEYIGAVDSNGRNTELTYYYKQNTDDNYIECVDSNTSIGPINVGEYFIKVIYTLSEGNINKQYAIEDIKFSILPKSIESSNIVVEKCTYLGTAVTPNIKVSINLNNKIIALAKDIDYTINYSNNENYGNGHIVINGIGNYSNTKEQDFVIRRAIYAINYEMDYSPSLRTWPSIKPEIKKNLSFKDYNDNSNVTISRDIITINSINDGTFEFNDTGNYSGEINNPITTGLETISNIIGSTYLINYNLSSDEFEVMTPNNNPNNKTITNALFKYKTVEVNSIKYTIEDAILLGSGNIVLLGDSSSASSFIYTAFCNLDSINYPYNLNANDKYSYTITNRNLIVPYGTSNNLSTLENIVVNGKSLVPATSGSNDNVYSSLFIPRNLSLDFNNSNLLVDAWVSISQPYATVVKGRGIVKNEGTINLNNSYLYAMGFLKGNGIINNNPNSTILDVFATYDWPGGNTASNLSATLPMNAWTIHNISCKTQIIGESYYKGCFYVQVSVLGSTKNVFTTVNIVNDKKNKAYLLKTSNSNDYLVKYTDYSNTLNMITGFNQIKEYKNLNDVKNHKDYIDVYGTYEDGIVSISAFGFSVATSQSKACPIGYMDINIKNNSIVSFSKASYLFLPGTKLTIDEGAILTTAQGVNLSFESYYHLTTINGNDAVMFTNRCANKVDAELIINGTFNCNGNLGGKIVSKKENAKLIFSSTANVSSSFSSICDSHSGSQQGSTDCSYKCSNYYAIGYINNIDNFSTFTKATYTSSFNDSDFFWNGTPGSNITVNSNGEISYIDSVSGACITEGTLITMADGTYKKVEDLEIGDMVLVFNHETGLWDTMPILVNVHTNQEKVWTNVINLHFDNDTTLKIVSEHGLYDLDLNKYVYINEDNVSHYINHRFVSTIQENNVVSTKPIKLTSYSITYENIKVYNPASVWHLNLVANDILTLSAGMVNFFEYDQNMKYNEELMRQDIEKYGLYTYEDFSDYVSLEVFNAFPFKYFKVAVGKGLITYEDIIILIEYYNESI